MFQKYVVDDLKSVNAPSKRFHPILCREKCKGKGASSQTVKEHARGKGHAGAEDATAAMSRVGSVVVVLGSKLNRLNAATTLLLSSAPRSRKLV